MWRAPPADVLSCTPTQRKSMVEQNPHLLFRRMDCLVVAIRKQDVSFIRHATNCDRAVHRHTGLPHRRQSNEGDEAEELNSSFPRQQERNNEMPVLLDSLCTLQKGAPSTTRGCLISTVAPVPLILQFPSKVEIQSTIYVPVKSRTPSGQSVGRSGTRTSPETSRAEPGETETARCDSRFDHCTR